MMYMPGVPQVQRFIPLVLEHSFTPISSGEDSAFAYFTAAIANHYNFLHFFHSTRYLSLLGSQRQYGIRSLPGTSALN